MVEIKDRESLENWLDGATLERAMAVASRAALRVWPYIVNDNGNLEHSSSPYNNIDITISSGRELLISTIAMNSYSPEISNAASRAVEASAPHHPSFYIEAALRAATGTAGSATIGTPKVRRRTNSTNVSIADALYNALNAVRSSEIAVKSASEFRKTATDPRGELLANTLWKNISIDASIVTEEMSPINIFTYPLWSKTNPLANEWATARKVIDGSNYDFSFWIDWYERILDGRPQNWDMLEEIALIDPEDWDQGAAHVNGLIAEIQTKYLRDATMIAETVGVREDTGLIYFEPAEIAKPDILAVILQRVGDALIHATGGNGLSENSFETKTFNLLIEKYADDPQRVEMDLEEIRSALAYQISTNELPESLEIRALLDRCAKGALDIRSTNADVAEAREMRARQLAREIAPDTFEKIEENAPALAEILEKDSAGKLDDDVIILRAIRDRTPIPFPDGATPLPALDAMNRIANRVAKITLLQKPSIALDKLEKNPAYRAGRAILALKSLVELFWGLFT